MTIAVALNATRRAIEGLVGTVRAVPTDTVQGQGYEGLTDEALGSRVLVKYRYDLVVDSQERTGGVGPESADTNIVQIRARVRLSLPTDFELIENARASVRSDAYQLAEQIRLALCMPGNITTDGVEQTGIVSGCWTQQGPVVLVREDWKKRIFILDMPLRCLVKQAGLQTWSPAQIDGLVIWADETGLQKSGGNVAAWANRASPAMPSFGAYDNTVVGTLPTVGTINGIECLEFNGSSVSQRLLSYSAITNGIQKTRWYAAIACEVDDASTNQANHWDNVAVFADTGRNWGVILRKVSGQLKASGYSYGTALHRAEIDIAAGFHVFEFWADGSNLWFRVDGGTAVADIVTPLAIERPLYVGGNGFNGAPVVNTLDGRIGELVVYRDTIADASKDRLRDYLTAKWYQAPVVLPAWTPLRLAALGAWFDETSLVQSAGKLTRWDEKTRVWIYEASNPTPAEQPTVDVFGSRLSAVFDGVDDSIFDSQIKWTIQAGSFDVFTALKIEGASLNGAAYDNHAVYCDSFYQWGLFVRVDAGQTYLQGYVYDGAGIRVAEVPVSQGVPLIVRFWGDGTNIGVQVDGGASATVASGPINNVDGQLFIGVNASFSGGYFTGRIGEHLSCRQKQSASDVTECFNYLRAKWT